MSGLFEAVRCNACVHRQDLGLYSHPKEFWGNRDRNHVNSKGKIPSTPGSSIGEGHPFVLRQFVGCLVACHPSNMLVYLGDGSAQKVQIELSISRSRCTDTGPTSLNADSTSPGTW